MNKILTGKDLLAEQDKLAGRIIECRVSTDGVVPERERPAWYTVTAEKNEDGVVVVQNRTGKLFTAGPHTVWEVYK
jgi:hypothetical protein